MSANPSQSEIDYPSLRTSPERGAFFLENSLPSFSLNEMKRESDQEIEWQMAKVAPYN